MNAAAFIRAAAPWVIMGLPVAVFAARGASGPAVHHRQLHRRAERAEADQAAVHEPVHCGGVGAVGLWRLSGVHQGVQEIREGDSLPVPAGFPGEIGAIPYRAGMLRA